MNWFGRDRYLRSFEAVRLVELDPMVELDQPRDQEEYGKCPGCGAYAAAYGSGHVPEAHCIFSSERNPD
jgi:hypothetical protein